MPSTRDHRSTRASIPDSTASDVGSGPKIVLVALDASESAAHAAFYGAGLARRSGGTLLLVHVRRPPVIWPDLGIIIEDYLDIASEPTPEVVVVASAINQQLCVDTELVVATGSPAREIARIAEDRHADLIVAGNSHSLRHRIAGSLSARLVRRRNWPIITVP